jgi:hypothetical protein
MHAKYMFVLTVPLTTELVAHIDPSLYVLSEVHPELS